MTEIDLAYLRDEKAVRDVTIDYTWSIDTKDFERLRDIFLADADITLAGQPTSGIEGMIAACEASLGHLTSSQHILGNHQITVDGDSATSRCYFQAQHTQMGREGGNNFVLAGRYEDELVRTPGGWRIAKRALNPLWTEGNAAILSAE